MSIEINICFTHPKMYVYTLYIKKKRPNFCYFFFILAIYVFKTILKITGFIIFFKEKYNFCVKKRPLFSIFRLMVWTKI